jgi:hypothetical protein
VARLADHLGPTCFDRPADWDELFRRSAHPGIAWFVFPAHRKAHTVYVPDAAHSVTTSLDAVFRRARRTR